MVHLCIVKSVVMWLHILVGPCRCVCVALFGSNITMHGMNMKIKGVPVHAMKAYFGPGGRGESIVSLKLNRGARRR